MTEKEFLMWVANAEKGDRLSFDDCTLLYYGFGEFNVIIPHFYVYT